MSESYHAYQLPLWSTSIEHTTPDCVCTGKQCSRCPNVHCLGNFHRWSRSKDGYRAECKSCRKNEYTTEEFKTTRRTHHKENADHINEAKRAWYHNNPEAGPGYTRSYRERNPDKVDAYTKQYNKTRWRERDTNRKMREKQAGGHYTAQQWRDLKAQYAHTCLCCKRREPEIKLVPDHVIPVVKMGSSNIDNIQPLCVTCNQSKSTKTTDYRSVQLPLMLTHQDIDIGDNAV